MVISTPRVVLAGLRGGSGKTTLSLGLIRAFGAQGLAVAPFKKGPDYIDAGWLGRAAGQACRNLDPFLMRDEVIQGSFAEGSREADISVVEGNRGVFDGMDSQGSCSTAELAKLLGAPVLLAIDCTKSTRTLGALVLGCQEFDPRVPWGGVILNQVAGTRQEGLVRRVIEERTGLPVLGALPRLSVLMGERHMGLTTHLEAEAVDEKLDRIGELVRAHVDIGGILDVARRAEDRQVEPGLPGPEALDAGRGCRIGVVTDSAFQFYYPENLACLTSSGAEIVQVDALSGAPVPASIHALYIGGGFPEVQTAILHENKGFRASLLSAAEDGLPIYAECGGLMLLGRSIETEHGSFEMTGILPLDFSMGQRPAAHGYTVAEVVRDNIVFDKGTVLRGHEFHYSSVVGDGSEDGDYSFRMKRGRGIRNGLDGLTRWNTIGTYTHVHALGTPEWGNGFLGAALRRRDRNI